MFGTVVVLPCFAKTLLESNGYFMGDPQAEKLYRVENPITGDEMLAIVYDSRDEIANGESSFAEGATLVWAKDEGLLSEGRKWLSELT